MDDHEHATVTSSTTCAGRTWPVPTADRGGTTMSSEFTAASIFQLRASVTSNEQARPERNTFRDTHREREREEEEQEREAVLLKGRLRVLLPTRLPLNAVEPCNELHRDGAHVIHMAQQKPEQT